VKVYATIRIGDPLNPETLMGPVHTKGAIREYLEGLDMIRSQGGNVIYGGSQVPDMEGNFVYPTLVEIDKSAEIIKTELFVPICHLIKFSTLEEAIEINNSVP